MLRIRTIVSIILIVLFGAVLFSFSAVTLLKKHFETALYQQELYLAGIIEGLVRQAAEQALEGGVSQKGIEAVLQQMADGRNIIYIGIIDEKGRVFASSVPGEAGSLSPLSELFPPEAGAGGERFYMREGGAVLVKSIPPPLNRDGYARIVVSGAAVKKELYALSSLVFWYSLISALLVALLIYLLIHRMFLRPVQKMLQHAERAAERGDVSPFLNLEAKGEMSRLSASIKSMLDGISRREEMLRESLGRLEKANKDLLRARREIIRSEKLASVGRLAAGLAHEIGNPLGIVLGYLSLLRDGKIPVEEKKEFIKRMEDELTRINRTIRQLLDFSKKSTEEKEKKDIRVLICQVLDLVSGQKPFAHLKIKRSLLKDLPKVKINEDHFKQVIMNLLLNAADAVEEGTGEIEVAAFARSGEVVVEVADNGRGIKEEHMDKIFDPFFTTKEEGRGTGLGLSVCLGLVEAMGGQLYIFSKEGEGTRAVISLPLEEEGAGVKIGAKGSPDERKR